MDMFIERSAVISECGLYRYRLERVLGGDGPVAAVFMVNPSTADAREDDATIRKLLGFGSRNRWSRIIVSNVFAYRATDIKELAKAPHPYGPDNDRYIQQALMDASLHVVAWGPLAKLPPSLRAGWCSVDKLAAQYGKDLYCWGTAQDGHPLHPLMLPYSSLLRRWRAPNPAWPRA